MAFNNPVNANQSGFQSLTTGGVWNGRTLTAGSGISISNGDGISGNPVISATGAASIEQVRNRSTTPITTGENLTATGTPTLANTDSAISLNITPSNSSNILMVQFCCDLSSLDIPLSYFFIFQDSVFKSGTIARRPSILGFHYINFMDYLTAGTTSSTNIQIRYACSSGDVYLLQDSGGSAIWGSGGSAMTLVVTEISP